MICWRLAETGGAVDERIRRGIELHRQQDAHRDQPDHNPLAELQDVILIENSSDDEDEGQMQKIRAKAKAGDQDERLKREIRLEDDEARRARKGRR